jgi:hypothetical protein
VLECSSTEISEEVALKGKKVKQYKDNRTIMTNIPLS